MTALRNIGLVARREILERGRSGYFIGSVAITLLVVVAVIAAPAFFDRSGTYTVGLVGDVPPALVTTLQQHPDADITTVSFADTDAGEAALADGTAGALLVGPTEGAYELVWQADPDPLLTAVATSAVAGVQTSERAARLGVDPADAAVLLSPPELRQRSLELDDPEQEGRYWITFMMLLLLFMTLVTYGTFVLTGVVEEKSNRVVELLLARVPPRHLLAGKVAGIGVLALAQLLLLAAAAVVTLSLIRDLPGPIPAVPVTVYVWLIVWYVLGYAFYSMAYGAVGALASRMEDAQTASGPLTFTLVAVYFFVFWFVVEDLDGVISVTASFVPLTAPLVMPLRLAFGSASAWEGALAAAVMVASIYGLVRLAGRIYTGAILRTGRRVSVREAWGGAR